MIMSIHLTLVLVLLLLQPIQGPNDPLEDKSDDQLELVFMGDIAFNSEIAERIGSEGQEYPFEHIKPYIERADLRFANLETPISKRGQREQGKYSTFRADPDVIDSLIYADMDVVSLANNHCLDYGPEALNDTMDNLENAGIGWSGIWNGEDPGDVPTEDALILQIEGRRIGFLACTEGVRDHWAATDLKLGPIPLDLGLMERKVSSLRSEVDILIVSIHWRKWPQYTMGPEPSDGQICHNLIDAGADIIMGHGPHTVHEIEGYKGGLILYSLGNVAMMNDNKSSERSFIAKVRISDNGSVSLELVPLTLGCCRYIPTGTPLSRTKDESLNVSSSDIKDMFMNDVYGLIDHEVEPSGIIERLRDEPWYVKLMLALILVLIILTLVLLRKLMKRIGEDG